MKLNKILIVALALLLWIPIQKTKAFDEDLQEKKWNTASGKSYMIYKTLEWTPVAKDKSKPAPGTLFVITYMTSQKPEDKQKLLEEYYDLMTHFYHFYAPESLKKKSFAEKIKYHVLVEALQEKPKVGEKNIKAISFSKNFNGITRIALQNKSLDPQRLEGLRALNARDYKKAIATFQKIKNKVAHDFVQMSNANLYMGKRDDAKKKALEGLKLFPEYRDLLHNLASITIFEGTYVTDGKYEYDPEKMNTAKKTLQKIIDLKQDDYLAHSNMATVETTLKNYEGAEKILKSLISKSSFPIALRKRLGDLYVIWKKHDLAEEAYMAGLKLNSNEPSLLSGLAELYHRDKKFDQAGKYYNEAIKQLEGRTPASEIQNKRVAELKNQLKMCQAKKALE